MLILAGISLGQGQSGSEWSARVGRQQNCLLPLHAQYPEYIGVPARRKRLAPMVGAQSSRRACQETGSPGARDLALAFAASRLT
jgi:hypothetical protein